MFTVEERDALRERVLELGEEDERVTAGAVVGSLADDSADRFSDVDLTFGISDGARVADVLEDWTRTLIEERDAVPLVDLERGPTTYRVFLLPDTLQLDISMTPAARFRPAGPRFRLLFGETANRSDPTPPVAGDLFIATARSPRTSSGGASSTRFTRAAASSADVSGRPSTTSGPCAITRSPSPVSVRDSLLRRRAPSTISLPRRAPDSSRPTSARWNRRHCGQPWPPPCSR
jgi:hypothetical protein